jgi:ribosomal protein L37E
MYKRFTAEDHEKFRALVADGKTAPVIAVEMGIHETTVSRLRSRLGLDGTRENATPAMCERCGVVANLAKSLCRDCRDTLTAEMRRAWA